MDTVQQLKTIVSSFLKVGVDIINENTLIDNSAIKGSIMIHRMYAIISRELKKEINGYNNRIRTFGQLLVACNLQSPASNSELKASQEESVILPNKQERLSKPGISIGIDIEDVENMPRVADCREDIFYKQHFTPGEISYCLLQPDPWQSFAGKFAAKEAIVKADNTYKGIPFLQIPIDSDVRGKPTFKNFALSISHNGQCAVAVAVRVDGDHA